MSDKAKVAVLVRCNAHPEGERPEVARVLVGADGPIVRYREDHPGQWPGEGMRRYRPMHEHPLAPEGMTGHGWYWGFCNEHAGMPIPADALLDAFAAFTESNKTKNVLVPPRQ